MNLYQGIWRDLNVWLHQINDINSLLIAPTLVGTAIILFFSISIIPFQQFSSQYSPAFIKYIGKEKRLWAGLINLSLILFIEFLLVLIPLINLHLIFAYFLVFLAFFQILLLWRILQIFLNPKDFLIPKIKDETINNISSAFEFLKKRADTVPEVYRNSEIKREEIKEAYEGIKRLKELNITFIRNNQTEMFQSGWDSTIDIIKLYLNKRKLFTNTLDDLLMDFSDDSKDIITAINQTTNLHFYRLFWKGLEEISIASLIVSKSDTNDGIHSLPSPITDLIKENIIKQIVALNTDAVFEGVKSLGKIGENFTVNGKTLSSAYICEDIFQIIRLTHNTKLSPVADIGKYYIAKIFLTALNKRFLFDNYHYPYKKFIKIYQEIFSLDPPKTLFAGNQIPQIEPDLLGDSGISQLIRAALFPENDEDDVIFYNLDVVVDLIDLMRLNFDRNQIFQSRFSSDLHQGALWLIAFIDEKITCDFLLDKSDITTPNKSNKQKALSALWEITSLQASLFIKSLKNDSPSNLLDIKNIFHSLISILYLIIYFNKVHRLNLSASIEEYLLNEILPLLDNLKPSDLDIVEYKMLEHFSSYLEGNGLFSDFQQVLKDFLHQNGSELRSDRYSYSPLRQERFSHIKRPKVIFNQDFFQKIDEEIFS